MAWILGWSKHVKDWLGSVGRKEKLEKLCFGRGNTRVMVPGLTYPHRSYSREVRGVIYAGQPTHTLLIEENKGRYPG